MIKNGGNLCYKLDFAAANSCRDTQAGSKAGGRARVGSAYIRKKKKKKKKHRRGLAHSLSEVMFNASLAAFACKEPLQWCKQDTF